MVKAVHVCHDLATGGVEEAIRSYFLTGDNLDSPYNDEVNLFIAPISNRYNKKIVNKDVTKIDSLFSSLNNPLAFLVIIFRTFFIHPDFIVCSLWRSMLIGVFFKLFTHVKVICFVHNEKYTHFLDRYFHILGLFLFDYVFVDSENVKNNISSKYPKRNISVVSFKTKNIDKLNISFTYKFIFWGRLVPQKRVDRVLKFIEYVHKYNNSVEMIFIGPCSNTNYISAIENVPYCSYLQEQSFDSIKSLASQRSFFIQLSDFEGMAMSVMESMQLGLVPIVTPVGQIKKYIINGYNGFIIDFDNQDSWYNFVQVLSQMTISTFNVFSNNSSNTWCDTPLYRESFEKGILDLCKIKD